MRVFLSLLALAVIALGIAMTLTDIPFGKPKADIATHYVENGREDTGAVNIITSVVLGYRGFDTLGEVAVLFVAAMGLGAVLATGTRTPKANGWEPASLVLYTGCRFLFPLIVLFGAYIFIHGHLTPGGGFQGGAIIASAFLLTYLGCRGRRVHEAWSSAVESLGGLTFVVLGLAGLTAAGHYFLSAFLPAGTLGQLFSGGIIPLIYIAIGLKVGSELAGVIDRLVEESQ
ncbi:Na(+)/H(+) antiporter subunit B [Candidatus Fermentibacterales bacterium]|nr:Na(+)/H(+) antiporter subunit B [Candidatus Fermentibacterales bacterium]